MKPPEILSILEEAAGTRMYDTKKEAALKTLEKKQSKVDEIDKLLDQEILPALEKLRKERMQCMLWANGNAELDRHKRLCIAYECVQAEKIRDSAVYGVEQVKMKLADIEDGHKRMSVETQEMEIQVSNLTVEKEASMGREVKVLSENVDALSRELVKQASVLKNQEDTLRSEKENAEKVTGAWHQTNEDMFSLGWKHCMLITSFCFLTVCFLCFLFLFCTNIFCCYCELYGISHLVVLMLPDC